MELLKAITSHFLAAFTGVAIYMLACQTFVTLEPMCRVEKVMYAGGIEQQFADEIRGAKRGK